MCIISIAPGNIYFKYIRCWCNRMLCTVAMFVAISIITSDTEVILNGNRVFPGGKERPRRDADPTPPSSARVKK